MSSISKITSSTNTTIKEVVKLRKHKNRDETGLTIVEGLKEIKSALAANVDIVECFFEQDALKDEVILKELKKRSKKVIEVTPDVFKKIAYGDRNDGVLLTINVKDKTLKDAKVVENGLYIVINHVEKPGNLGAILRSCDGVGVDTVFVSDQKTDIYNPNVIRSSLGTIFNVPTIVCQTDQLISYLKDNSIKIVAATPDATVGYDKIDFNQRVAIVVGSEQDGLNESWLTGADYKVRIPMNGQADSLNVSTSSAVILYEALRQRS